MGFFDLFRQPTPLQRETRRFVPMLIRYRRKYPDRPLRDAVKPVIPVLRALGLKPELQQLLTLITSEDYNVNSVKEYACALVALMTDTPVDASVRYQDLVKTVEAELQARNYTESK